MIGLVALCVLSVSVAVSNNRAAEAARRSDRIAHMSEEAFDALLVEEDAADSVVADNDPASRRAYTAANEDSAASIAALRESSRSGSAFGAPRLVMMHHRYSAAVAALIDGFAGGPLGPAEAFEEAEVDPYFDPLAEALNQERKDSDVVAHEALASIERDQQRLLALTPLVAVISLALIVVFVVKLGRTRREVARKSEESDYQSLHDDLTGLPNRSLLRRSSALAVAQAENTGTQMALMVLDLDRFKEINDTLGHHAGDLVLEAVAQRLRSAVRSTDTVARLGGDEFAILLPHVTSPAAAVDVAAKVQLALVSSIDVGGIALDIDVSIGIALSGAHGRDVATLLQHADIGMYRAKDLDLGICMYDADHDENSRVKLGLLGQLRRAIDDSELTLDFQPKVALGSGEFCGAEALVRWRHPTQGLLPPGDFLPAAERTALIRPLTQFVINAALAECDRWKREGTDLRLAVNISARNLLDAKFPDQVAALLVKWDLPAGCLVFEVTESAIIVDPERAKAMLSRFARLGIELAIDDFGAGYTSLAHLRTLPVRELKIDQSLTAQMAVSARDALIVKALIDLGHNLGMRTVAEGIEDAETFQRLALMGCDVGQGYHIARPMDGVTLWQWHLDHVPAANPPR